MLIFTTENIPGVEVEVLGMVQGTIVQAKHIGHDFLAGLKNIVGGEVASYTDMLCEARNIATQRMIFFAEQMQADAIVGVRYGSAEVMQGAAEILAYGTAVKIKSGNPEKAIHYAYNPAMNRPYMGPGMGNPNMGPGPQYNPNMGQPMGGPNMGSGPQYNPNMGQTMGGPNMGPGPQYNQPNMGNPNMGAPNGAPMGDNNQPQ